MAARLAATTGAGAHACLLLWACTAPLLSLRCGGRAGVLSHVPPGWSPCPLRQQGCQHRVRNRGPDPRCALRPSGLGAGCPCVVGAAAGCLLRITHKSHCPCPAVPVRLVDGWPGSGRVEVSWEWVAGSRAAPLPPACSRFCRRSAWHAPFDCRRSFTTTSGARCARHEPALYPAMAHARQQWVPNGSLAVVLPCLPPQAPVLVPRTRACRSALRALQMKMLPSCAARRACPRPAERLGASSRCRQIRCRFT